MEVGKTCDAAFTLLGLLGHTEIRVWERFCVSSNRLYKLAHTSIGFFKTAVIQLI
jgi:hypothetical protein